MHRPLACLLAASAAALVAGACESPTGVSAKLGPLLALDSLRTADGADLPCCTVDTAGAKATLVGGALSFRARTTFTDTVITPVGPADSACMNAVDGILNVITGVATLPDGSTYIVIPCHVGTYSLALTQRLDLGNGRSETSDIVVSSGTYTWKRDTLSLAVTAGLPATATMTADTIAVSAAGHTYKLQAVASY